MQLPPALTTAIAALLEGMPRKELVAAAAKMSDSYRAGATSRGIVTPADAAAYAVARMPATYAACAAVLARLGEAMPDFAPASLLDVGAGTGAASWAAATVWPDIAVTMLDHNPALRALARRLADGGPLVKAEILAGDLGVEKPSADLVIASYVLAELPEEKVASAAADLWHAASGALVLVEPGTPQGFGRIRAARAVLIQAGGHVAAPCTHDNACPMSGSDWCHFSQRLARSRDHMLMKGATAPFEDERYAYLVVTRQGTAQGARIHDSIILAPPLQTKPGLTFKLCDETGLRSAFVPVRDKDEYRRVRKKEWGDRF